MFANRFTALVDANVLAGALKRNLILTLAEGEFFRLRWSRSILGETERAIAAILAAKLDPQASDKAGQARAEMEKAFPEAIVLGFEHLLQGLVGLLPDPGDDHVLAAAMQTQAAVIVTDNLKHFPAAILHPRNLDPRSSDEFIADTIALDHGRAVAALREMRQRFAKPALTAAELLLTMEAHGLHATVDELRLHVASL
jgi:predicted nucleic acid-binding protein